MAELMKRKDQQEEDTWRLEDLFETDELWEKELSAVESALPVLTGFAGRLGNSAGELKEALDYFYGLYTRLDRLVVYASQRSDEDTGNGFYQDMKMRVQSLAVRAQEAAAFLVPEILGLEEMQVQQWLREDRGLALYGRALQDMMRKKSHVLSREQEELLSSAREVGQSSNIFNVMNNADLKFPSVKDENGEEIPVTHGSYVRLLESRDRSVRKAAFESVYGTYGQFGNTLAATFAANVKEAAFFAKARRYSSARAYFLDDANVPEQVYDSLISSVHQNLPALHDYVALRKKLLGTDELHMYDVYVPVVDVPDKKYSFEEAKQVVFDGLEPLGDEYRSILKEGYENRWIDIYENEGKRSGAYSWGAYGTHPYVLLNYQENLNDVFTLAHEMGHAIHSYYSGGNQPAVYAEYKIFVAEVASTCNEALLIRYLLKKSGDAEERKYLLNHFLEKFRGTLFRQTQFAEFELKAHEKEAKGETLTFEALCSLYLDINQKYFGPSMEEDQEIGREWARIPHFYTPFYVYQYATGFSAAIALSDKILEEGQTAVEKYKEFLKGGCSKDPIDLLKTAGVDLSTPEPVDRALKVFRELLEEFKSLI